MTEATDSEGERRQELIRLAPPGLSSGTPAVLDERVLDLLERAYADPPRAYHSLEHIVEVARHFADIACEGLWKQPREVYLAMLFHDAIYRADRADNEAESASLLQRSVDGERASPPVDLDRAAELVTLTAMHGRLGPSDVAGDAALFLDCDMAILGAPAERYDAFEAAIAVEYASAPPDLYRAGRRAFLARLARSPRIFVSDRFHTALDAPARENLARALSTF